MGVNGKDGVLGTSLRLGGTRCSPLFQVHVTNSADANVEYSTANVSMSLEIECVGFVYFFP